MSQADQSNSTKTSAKSLSRRKAVGLSLGGALAMAAGGTALASAPDPIFAAIEAHKAAFQCVDAAVKISGALFDDDPGYAEAEAATGAAWDAENRAVEALMSIRPTTFAGVTGLLKYIDDFNRGVIPGGEHWLWPDEATDDDILTVKGHPLTMPFPFWIMRNVHRTLQGLMV